MAGDKAGIVFVSYAHEDADHWEQLEVMLRPVVRPGRLNVWADTAIVPSERWNAQIAEALGRAEVAVLLVSKYFLASHYITKVELPRLLDRGVPLVCVPVADCLWREVEALSSVQWALPPEKPLRAMSGHEQDSALVAVYEAIVEVLAIAKTADEQEAPRPATPRVVRAPLAGSPGQLLGVPDLPPAYQPRPADLHALKAHLATAATVGLVGRAPHVGLHGAGGVGKSVLAAAACHDPEIRSWFPDGVCWVTLGEDADLVEVQARVAGYFGAELSATRPRDGLEELRGILLGWRCLVVVDDVWSIAAAEAFDATSPLGRVLYTTRAASVLDAVGATPQPVDVLSLPSAVEFLRATGPPVGHIDEQVLEEAVHGTGGVILALALVAALARAGRGWAQLAGSLGELAQVFRDHPYADVFKAMRLATDALSPSDARCYRMLGVFGEDLAVPEDTIARLWGAGDPSAALGRLAATGLLGREGGRVRLHDLQRAFVLFDAKGPIALAHRQLLDSHRPPGGWGYLPDSEPYLWDHLVSHIVGAGDEQELVALVSDGRWLARRLHLSGAYAAEADLARAAAALPANPSVRRTLRILRRWGHLFKGLELPEVAVHLISRLPEAAAGGATLAGPHWLQPHRAWPLPEPTDAFIRALEGHTDNVEGVAFSPDGATLASAGADGTVRLWDATNGAARATLEGHTDRVLDVAFSPDGATLASAAADGTVRLWDAISGAARFTLKGDNDRVLGVAFSPDGATLASAGADGTVRLWDATSGAARATLKGHGAGVWGVSFSSDGAALALCVNLT